MTSNLGELQCTVERLDKEARASYQTLSDVWATQKRMDNRLHLLEKKVDALEGRLEGLTTKLKGLADELGKVVEALPGRE